MATTSIPHRWKYDVFVSFRGDDIRKNFMDHMFSDFNRKGIRAFRDDRQLPKGEAISDHLYKAIEESRFLIVIFSKNYASSSWCLRELVRILQCKQIKNPKHEVRIIFYDVKPDVVRKQTGSFAEAFDKHDVSNRTEVDKWKKALSMAANLSGWDLEDKTNGYESKFIDSISREILKTLCDGPLHVGGNLVGLDVHIDKLDLARFIGSDKVNMIGICGISGIGKTTFAKAIYNSMYTYFEGSCFCDDVQGVTKRQGLTQVQMQLIDKIMKTKDVKISSISEGTVLIKKGIACKPILLVLDDVDDREQLEALVGSPDWFCPGSLIIFTGKDKQLLRSHKVDIIHEMETLDDFQAHELFILNAFGKKHPTEDYKEITSQVVKSLQGHPLALKVFGCLLYGKSVHVWQSQFDRLQSYPNSEIQQKLRPSYDGLDFDQKRIFLDIACSFIGENKDFVANVLDDINCFAHASIEVLVDKSLITLSQHDMSLQMHELVQSMAREIVREESNMPGHRSRIWISSAFYDVLSENKVTEEVEVLVLLLKKYSHKIQIDGNAFTHMKNLRILKIYFPKAGRFWQPFSLELAVNYSGTLQYLSNKLRLLYWHGYPFEFLPSNFYPENIVAIDLSYSRIKKFWTKPKNFTRLKVMKLRYCLNLISTPDFTEIRNLEELNVEGCVNLVEVHPSIGLLKKLVVLNMTNCKRFECFPLKVEMDSLQVLCLSGCLKLDKLPEFGVRTKTFVELHINRTAIKELPSFVFSLENLESLSFVRPDWVLSKWWTSSCRFSSPSKQQYSQTQRSVSFSLAGLHKLQALDFSYCNLEQVPESIGGLSFLSYLNLSGNSFTSLPGSLSQLSYLETLELDGCKKLEVLPELPPYLRKIYASDCTSLREVPGSSRNRFNDFRNCPKLFKNVTIDSQGSILKTQCLDSSITSQGSIHHLSAFLGYSGFQTNRCEFFCLPGSAFDYLDIGYHGNSIPEWFTNRSTENHVKVELPLDWCFNKFKGFGICVVFKCKKPHKFIGYSVKNFNGVSMITDKYPHIFNGSLKNEVIWLHYRRDTREWKEANNFVTFSFQENNEDFEVKECGVRLIFDKDIQQEADLSMLHGLPTPTQDDGMLGVFGAGSYIYWSW